MSSKLDQLVELVAKCMECHLGGYDALASDAFDVLAEFWRENAETIKLEQAEAADGRMASPVPAGVSYRPDADNFYREDTRESMGLAFYDEWRHRRDEFPQLAAPW